MEIQTCSNRTNRTRHIDLKTPEGKTRMDEISLFRITLIMLSKLVKLGLISDREYESCIVEFKQIYLSEEIRNDCVCNAEGILIGETLGNNKESSLKGGIKNSSS